MKPAVAALLLLLPLVLSSPAGAAEIPTRIELYTMGSGDDVFEAFGHSTLCVLDDEHPRGVCYNYGTTDFSNPPELVWDVLRGRAVFWAARMPLPLMLQAYVEDDRTIFRQKLELPPGAAETLAARLEADVLPENRNYVYHHYRENCATRLRDHLDAASGGALARGADRPFGESYRTLTQRGFASSIWMLAGMELLVGRLVDARPTVWEAMFLPEVLRAETARRFQARPEVFHLRVGPVPTLPILAGRHVVWALAAGLTLIVGAAAALGRQLPWSVALAATGLVLGLGAILVDATAIVATLAELRRNEVLVVLLPTDLAIGFLRGRALFVYLAARLLLLGLVAAAMLTGFLLQPMWAVFALAAGPMTLALVGAVRMSPRGPQDLAM